MVSSREVGERATTTMNIYYDSTRILVDGIFLPLVMIKTPAVAPNMREEY